MPDAQTHDLITVATGVVLAPLCYLLLSNDPATAPLAMSGATLYGACHIVSGMMFSPDLDIDSAIDNRWGIFFWIWRPYMWLVPHRHRILSHGPILSALIRLAYFYGIVWLLLLCVDLIAAAMGIALPSSRAALNQRLLAWISSNRLLAGCCVLGFVTGSDAHIIADWLVSHHRRFLRRLGIRLSRRAFGPERRRWLK